MDHRVGLESSQGIGGGGISEESLKNYEIGAELARRRQPNEAYVYLFKAALDERNVDACTELAFLQPNNDHCLTMLSQATRRATKLLKGQFGPKVFDVDGGQVGRFWDIVETRPYMRALRSRVKLAFIGAKYQDCADTMIEMIRLTQDDRLSQHQWLGSVLCRLGRWSDALYFVQVYSLSYIGKGSIPAGGGTVFKAPFQRFCSPQDENILQKVICYLTYPAAMAAFRLWGDCQESRQYLRIASRGNPHVMVKILARIKRPETQNNEARPYNGSEDAHDYLWLSQDLWMEADIWDWVNAQPEAHEATWKECGNKTCEKHETYAAEFQRCSSCHQSSYCSPKCQKADWKNVPCSPPHDITRARRLSVRSVS